MPHRQPGAVVVEADHAGGEEHGVFPVGHPAEPAGLVVAVGVRALDEPDGRVGEVADGPAQPVGLHVVVGVDNADERRLGVGVGGGPVQRSGLGAADALHVQEPEPGPESGAVGFDGTPQGGVGGVVVDDEHLEGWVVQLGEAVEGADDQLRRLGVAGHVDRDHGEDSKVAGVHVRGAVPRMRSSGSQASRIWMNADGAETATSTRAAQANAEVGALTGMVATKCTPHSEAATVMRTKLDQAATPAGRNSWRHAPR